MSTTVIHRGQTDTLRHPATFSGTLILQGALAAGGPYATGVIAAGGVLTNTGLIMMDGGTGGGSGVKHGAALINDGVLLNRGTLALSGGQTGSQSDDRNIFSATLSNAGSLDNAGALNVAGGGGSYGSNSDGGRGGAVYNTGVLNNTGMVTLAGGAAGKYERYNYDSGLGGVISNDGTLINSGTIALLAGTPATLHIGDHAGGGGGELRSDGVEINAGLITVQGGLNSSVGVSYAGYLSDFGTLTNSGTIVLNAEAGPPGLFAVSTGAALIMDGGTITGGGEFYLSSFQSTVSGTGVISVGDFADQGTVGVSSGLLVIDSMIRNEDTFAPGLFQIGAAGTLALNGSFYYGVGRERISIAQGGTLVAVAATVDTPIVSPDGGVVVLNGGGTAALNAADTHLTVTLTSAGTLTLSRMSFITAVGADGGRDTFADTAAGFNGDSIGNFVGTDRIDVTDLASGAGLSLAYTQAGNAGALTLSEGGVTTTITLLGSFTAGQFATHSDGHGGVEISLN